MWSWDTLNVAAGYASPTNYTDNEVMVAAGFLEGALTHQWVLILEVVYSVLVLCFTYRKNLTTYLTKSCFKSWSFLLQMNNKEQMRSLGSLTLWYFTQFPSVVQSIHNREFKDTVIIAHIVHKYMVGLQANLVPLPQPVQWDAVWLLQWGNWKTKGILSNTGYKISYSIKYTSSQGFQFMMCFFYLQCRENGC